MCPMAKQSDRRDLVLSFIHARLEAGFGSPTYEEIAESCGLSNRASAGKVVKALEREGRLEVAPGKARAMRPAAMKHALFEVDPTYIQSLDDTQFRELIARLCEAEMALHGLPSDCVRWGGDQRAPDGGLDVRVHCLVDHPLQFPRAEVGYQAKATVMGPAKVYGEMRPHEVLRPEIDRLLREGGAYIICTSESVANVKSRLEKMREACVDIPGLAPDQLDFYDARALASWTNRHPGVVAWVHAALGRPIAGWRPFGQWTGRSGPLIDDAQPRVLESIAGAVPISIADGLARVADLLRPGGACVRIVGLSGVGKTRFVQALFEPRDGFAPLSPASVLYTDSEQAQMPAPYALIEELRRNGRQALIIVDNCPPRDHRRLVEACRAGTGIRLLTIEYDIQDDTPEGGHVVRLNASSASLIADLLEREFEALSPLARSAIARFSKGNARLAIAMARAVPTSGSLMQFSDSDLFERLFWQRNEKNQHLLEAAEICSLVYSFDGIDQSGELRCLSELLESTPQKLATHVAELYRRDLVQKRGKWRAVLPQALASWLARRALGNMLPERLEQLLMDGTPRLAGSFTRRLGYLHQSEEAKALVDRWLQPDGRLAASLIDLTQMNLLVNVAPADPVRVLEHIEYNMAGSQSAAIASHDNLARDELVKLLRHLAWDAPSFPRCIKLLLVFVQADASAGHDGDVAAVIESMFSLHLSGTKALPEHRAGWIRTWIESGDPVLVRLGWECLDNALNAHSFTSGYSFDFGAQPRDYGYSPETYVEVHAWYALFLGLAESLTAGDLVGKVRQIVARRFRELWVHGLYDQLESIASKLKPLSWPEGWHAVRMTRRFDAEKLDSEGAERLTRLELQLRPATLIEDIRATVFSSSATTLDITDGDDDEDASRPWERALSKARALGVDTARDAAVLNEILPSLVKPQEGRLGAFAEGLATGAQDARQLWDQLVDAFSREPADSRSSSALSGFLCGLSRTNPPLTQQLLQEAVGHPVLATAFPVLQAAVELDDEAVRRLLTSLKEGKSPIGQYSFLGMGRCTQPLSDQQVAALVRGIAARDHGYWVALDVLGMAMWDGRTSEVLRATGRELLESIEFSRAMPRVGHQLARLVRRCLSGPESIAAACAFSGKLATALKLQRVSIYEFYDVVEVLFAEQPMAALDSFAESDVKTGPARRGFLRLALAEVRRRTPLSKLRVSDVIEWCKRGPDTRWAAVTEIVPLWRATEGDQHPRFAEALLREAPDSRAVLTVIVDRLIPMAWSGSQAQIVRDRMCLLDSLLPIIGAQDARWLKDKQRELMAWVARRDQEERATTEEPDGFE